MGSKMIHEDALAQMLSGSRSMLLACGLRARTVESAGDQEMAMLGIRDRKNHPVLSPDHHDFAIDDMFGILIEGKEGLVGGMACKHVPLGRDNLANHLVSSNRRVYGEGMVTTNAVVAKQLTGSLVYQGELFLDAEWRNGKAPVPAIMHLAHSLSALKWHADWHYAFMPVAILNKAPAFGFHHFDLCTQTYDERVPLRSSKECLVYSSHQDICERAKVMSRLPDVLEELTIKSSS